MRKSCPYCGSSGAREGPTRDGLTYRICAACGSGYLAEMPMDARAYYQAYDPTLVRSLPEILKGRYNDTLAWIEASTKGRRLLEVGCGNGHFLELANRRGWTAKGIELSRAHVDRAGAQGLDVVYGDLRDDDLFAGERFHVAVAIEVLEHLEHPGPFLATLAQRLEIGGLVYLTTPNFGSMTRRLVGDGWSVLADEHVALASPRGLVEALAVAGLQVVRLRSKNLYLGDYRRAVVGRRDSDVVPLASENAELRDRIEESAVLRAAKAAANAVLGATGLGESLECLAQRVEQ